MALLYRPLTINDYWETVADCSNFTKIFLGNTFNLINKKNIPHTRDVYRSLLTRVILQS